MSEQPDVIERLRSVFLRDENALLAYLFGSRVRGFTTPLSDFDVAVLLKDDSLRRLSSLWSEVAKALGVSEDKVDLVEIKGATIHLKLSIVKNGLKLVDRGGYEEELRRELIGLALELEDALGVEVDVVDLRAALPLLAYEVVSKGIVVVDRGKGERASFETMVLKEYLDLKPRLEKYYGEVLSKQTRR